MQVLTNSIRDGWYATTPELLHDRERIVRQLTKGGVTNAEVTALLDRNERAVQNSPDACFVFDDAGYATLTIEEQSFAAGHFSICPIDDLRRRASEASRGASGQVRLSVLHGAHPLTDIGSLQASAPAGTLFQVASQFDCLEAPSAAIVLVRNYTGDSTQGPRASVSAFPATLLRHYRAPAPDGNRFQQTDANSVNLLGEVFGAEIARVQAGYLQAHNVLDPAALARALEERFGRICVGVHDDVEVVFGYDWGGPVPAGKQQRIAQVFTSTIALGRYSVGATGAEFVTIRRQLLRAAYLGTLLAAIALRKHTVVLTMIGGGVFGNPHREIWDAIHWALAEVDPMVGEGLQVVVNTREHLGQEEKAKVRARGGAVAKFSHGGIDLLR